MSQRTSIFSTPESSKRIDVSDFVPKSAPAVRPAQEDIDSISKGGRFTSREPASETPQSQTEASAKTSHLSSSRREPMIYRTGRTVTFSAKATQETISRFYEMAKEQGWKANETFEKAVAALEDAIRAGKV